jgi:hypothetical protein
MINYIVPGAMIDVSEGGYSSGPYVDMSRPSAGMVRYNGNNFEVYDGSSWMTITTNAPQVSLNSSAITAITWALSKMAEEAELEKMSRSHPSIQAAYDNLKRAAEQLKTTIILSKDEQSTS